MKILLAVDRSTPSRVAVEEVGRRPWPAGSELKVLTVVEPPHPQLLTSDEFSVDVIQHVKNTAQSIVEEAVAVIRGGEGENLDITPDVLTGSPEAIILEESERWDADLIIVGAHNYHRAERAFFGSVSQAVVMNARCSVEVVRDKSLGTREGQR